MKQLSPLSLFLSTVLIFFVGCTKTSDTDLSPSNDHTEPIKLTYKIPEGVKASWVRVSKSKPVPRKVKTLFKPFTDPVFYINRFNDLKSPMDSLTLNYKELPSTPFITSKTIRKVTPKIILLGKPEKTKALPAIVENSSTAALMQLSVDQGLPGTAVSSLAQESNGRLWIGTDHGLSLFDGEYFYTWYKRSGLSRDEIRFVYKDKRNHIWVGANGVDEIIPDEGIIKHYGKLEGLSQQGVPSVKEDNKGRILFSLVEGVDILDPITNTITHLGAESGITPAIVNKLIEDKKGRIWLALNGKGVNIIDPKEGKVYSIKDSDGLSNNDIRDLIEDKHGNIWMAGWNGGVDCYDVTHGKLFQLREKHGLCDRYIRTLLEDLKGQIWIGCLSGGLDVYDPASKKLCHLYGKKGIVKSDSRCLLEDDYHRIWIGTNGGGLLVFDNTKGSFDNFDTKWRFAKAPINTMLEDADGNFIIGTGGQGLDIYNVKNKTLEHLMNEDWTDGWLNKLYDDSTGRIWMTTDNRLDVLNKKTHVVTSWGKDEGLPHEVLRSFLFNKDGNILLGSGGGLDKFDTLTGMFSHLESPADPCKNIVIALAFAPDGHLWIATYSEGVYEFDPQTLLLRHYWKQQGLGKTFIYSMLVDKKGYIWLGTGGDGLKILDPKQNTLTQLSTADGLSEMTILSLLEKDDYVYAGAIKGLSIIQAKGNKFQISNYDKPQGLMANDFNQGAVMSSVAGQIWWGIGEVLSIFNPSKHQNIEGKTFISSIDIMGKELVCENKSYLKSISNKDTIWSPARDTFYFSNSIRPDTGYFKKHSVTWDGISGAFNLPEKLSLPYNQDHVTFHYTSNFLANTNRTTYRYMLSGIDKTWNAATSQTSADYRNLPPGKYTFKVFSRNFNGPVSNVAEIQFSILPPWWKTTLAYVLYCLLFLGSIIGYNRLRTAQLLSRQRVLEKNVKERTVQIEKQKDEIGHQKLIVEEKQKEIVDSILYAKRIQYALLAHTELLQKNLKELFILFQPKDIVSGDFYWATSVQREDVIGASGGVTRSELFYLAVCDSTGHGVPGAFMSLLNISFLNEAINEKKISSPDKILNYVRERLITSLSQDGGQDGMDGILICINSTTSTITYAAGNNSPLLYNGNSLTELPCNKMPIGKGEKSASFTLHTINTGVDSILYLYTDGFADQFGGPNGKKFKRKKLNEIIMNNASLPLKDQREILHSTLTEWKGDLEQVDDVCIIGIRI